MRRAVQVTLFGMRGGGRPRPPARRGHGSGPGRAAPKAQGDQGHKHGQPVKTCDEPLHLPLSHLDRRLIYPPWGVSQGYMSEPHIHTSHPAIAKRLKRAEGHLRRVIAMIEEGRPCLDLATQLHAVERAVAEAKRALIHDHIDHCVTGAHDLTEIKSLTKLL